MIENSADKRALTAHTKESVLTDSSPPQQQPSTSFSLRERWKKKNHFASELSIVFVCRGQNLTKNVAIYKRIGDSIEKGRQSLVL